MKRTMTTMTFLLAALMWARHTNGQNRYTLPQITPQSPNAASLGKYGEVPVSLGNGMANLSVPLINVKANGVALSIGLSYHSNGLKVDEIPSWAGLGWDINAGGVINYEQRGNPDFDEGMAGLFTSPTAKVKLGRYLRNEMTATEKYSYLEEVIDGGAVDAEYDLYHFNFMGRSGSFYFDSMQRIVQVPKGNISIVRQGDEFVITDEMGHRYIFDMAEQGTMGPLPVTGLETRKSFSGISSFLLGRIVAANGREIVFNYTQYPAGQPMAYQKQGHQLTFYPIPAFAECPGGSSYSQYATGISVKNHLLQSIAFDGGSIVFETGSAGREDIKKLTGSTLPEVPALRKVKLLDAAGITVDEYVLQHSYFGSNDRLRLDAVVHTGSVNPADGGASSPERWEFGYYGQGEPAFPPLFSKGKDHWGYHNGAANGTNSIPSADYAGFITGWRSDLNGYVDADRSANGEKAKWGLLQTVTYPTGGTAAFAYEPNRVVFANYQQVNNPFLFRAVQANINYGALVDVDTDYGPSMATGSFSITGSGPVPVKVSASKEVNPTAFINGSVTVSALPNGPNLLELFAQQPNTANHYTDKTLYLDPGTYYYSVYKNVDSEFNATGGRARLTVLAPATVGPHAVAMQVGGCRISSVTSSDGLGNGTLKKYIYNDSVAHVAFGRPYYISKSYVRRNRYSGTFGNIMCQDCGQETKVHDESVVPMPGPSISYSQVTELVDSSGANGKTEYRFSLADNLSLNGTQPYVSPFMATWRGGLPLLKTVYKREGSNFAPLMEELSSYGTGPTENTTWGLKADYWAHCDETGPNNRVISETRENYQTENFYLSGSTSTLYDSTGTIAGTSGSQYSSARHILPTETRQAGSGGTIVIKRIKYCFDYDTSSCTGTEALGLRLLQRRHILVPVEQLAVKNVGGQEYVVGGSLTVYHGNSPLPHKVYELELAEPLPIGSYMPSAINAAGSFVYDSRYRERAVFAAYDDRHNVLEERYSSGRPQSYIWDYGAGYLVAQCTNAVQADIAATSFEADGKGNFMFGGLSVADADAPTGSRAYPLTAGNIAKTVDAAKQYTLSLWAKGSVQVSGGSLQRTGKTLKGYTYYEYAVAGTGSVSISGTGTVDELRLYPADAQMVTYTYRPMVGVASQSDANGLITYYGYDAMGRLQYLRDMDGKVLKAVKYGVRKNMAD